RAQSKAMVLKPNQGDAVIITTNFRPVLGTKGYYRANMRHGVSEVTSGRRFTLGIVFHDAA
ncbi:MAG TPA: 2OG-Fe(II) oxygenase, partial [Cyclobacteriaceae bacterium]|nr:2OG-Fe(II) oxygenase [Cyclobacteriaceae bacterium]